MWSYIGMKETLIAFSEAKAHLSAYARRAEAGQSTLVMKTHRPAFVIAPLPTEKRARVKKPGLAKGQIRMAPDFDQTPKEVIDGFEGES